MEDLLLLTMHTMKVILSKAGQAYKGLAKRIAREHCVPTTLKLIAMYGMEGGDGDENEDEGNHRRTVIGRSLELLRFLRPFSRSDFAATCSYVREGRKQMANGLISHATMREIRLLKLARAMDKGRESIVGSHHDGGDGGDGDGDKATGSLESLETAFRDRIVRKEGLKGRARRRFQKVNTKEHVGRGDMITSRKASSTKAQEHGDGGELEACLRSAGEGGYQSMQEHIELYSSSLLAEQAHFKK